MSPLFSSGFDPVAIVLSTWLIWLAVLGVWYLSLLFKRVPSHASSKKFITTCYISSFISGIIFLLPAMGLFFAGRHEDDSAVVFFLAGVTILFGPFTAQIIALATLAKQRIKLALSIAYLPYFAELPWVGWIISMLYFHPWA